MAPETTTTYIQVVNITKDTPDDAWGVQNDGVMGGCSTSKVEITDDGHVRFTGHVSLENNGGFASIIHSLPEPVEVAEAASFQVRLRGDGKDYTLRVKSDPDQQYYHEFTFPTKVVEAWETIGIPFAAMKAMHHGEPVDVPNYAGQPVSRVQFLIGNGKEEDFTVLLDAIEAV